MCSREVRVPISINKLGIAQITSSKYEVNPGYRLSLGMRLSFIVIMLRIWEGIQIWRDGRLRTEVLI
jgi:hypothetical protein